MFCARPEGPGHDPADVHEKRSGQCGYDVTTRTQTPEAKTASTVFRLSDKRDITSSEKGAERETKLGHQREFACLQFVNVKPARNCYLSVVSYTHTYTAIASPIGRRALQKDNDDDADDDDDDDDDG